MYLLYVDESGDSRFGEHDNFVLGAVAVHEGQVYQLGKKLDALQGRYLPDVGFPVSFHATDIRSGKGRFNNMPPQRREELMEDMDEIIGSSFPVSGCLRYSHAC